MEYKWHVDDDNVVTLRVAVFGRHKVQLNGIDVGRAKPRRAARFSLNDGRAAIVRVTQSFGSAPEATLEIDEELVRLSAGGVAPSCPACNASISGMAKFCDSCGAALPSASNVSQQQRVKAATNYIAGLAVLFAISGVILFFLQRTTSTEALEHLAALSPDETVTIQGSAYVVEDLRAQVAAEPWVTLILNLLLATLMVGLFRWGQRAPFPAMVVAAAVYAVVIVGNAIVDPATIAQGIVIKVIVVLALYKGIKASLQLRPASG